MCSPVLQETLWVHLSHSRSCDSLFSKVTQLVYLSNRGFDVFPSLTSDPMGSNVLMVTMQGSPVSQVTLLVSMPRM